MKKVILKCKLQNRDTFEDKLSDIDMDFGAIYWQHDRVYVPRGYKPKSNFPRLVMRTELKAIDEQPQYFLILRRHIEDSGIDIIERTPVTDYTATVNIVLQLGFRQAGEVSRRRQDLDMGEGTIIHLDTLDGRDGAYAKIETNLTDTDSVEAARSDLRKTFETLGETNFVESAYFEL
jgi:adenylate cyclase class IV